MKIGLVSDGEYGERAFLQIRRHFPAEWILLSYPASAVVDETDLHIPPCDLYISYLRHPDIAMELVRTNVPVLLGVNHGPGFIAQARTLNPAVFGPETMCSLSPDTSSVAVNKYAKVFGRPNLFLILDGRQVKWCVPLLRSPCGSTDAACRELNGKILNEETLNQFALSVCHSCRAPRFGKTCDKEKAGIIHLEALMKAVQGSSPKLRGVLEEFCDRMEKQSENAPPAGD